MLKQRTELEEAEAMQCPVCGFLCVGKGGVGCIDKLGLVNAIKERHAKIIKSYAPFELHHRGPCTLCVDAGNDFDYCRACGFTEMRFADRFNDSPNTPISEPGFRNTEEKR